MLETLVIYGEQILIFFTVRTVSNNDYRSADCTQVAVRTVLSFDINGWLYVQAQYAQ